MKVWASAYAEISIQSIFLHEFGSRVLIESREMRHIGTARKVSHIERPLQSGGIGPADLGVEGDEALGPPFVALMDLHEIG